MLNLESWRVGSGRVGRSRATDRTKMSGRGERAGGAKLEAVLSQARWALVTGGGRVGADCRLLQAGMVYLLGL